MKDKTFLMIPGPTPVPESVLLAMAKHPIGHRSTEFSAVLKRVYEDMKLLFQTKNDVLVFTASGTGAMEAAIFNLVNPGDKVLSLVIGNFGERWAKISEMKGAVVTRYTVDPGCAIDPAEVKKILDADVNKEYKIVTLTHNETATGVTNDVEVVDGVTSLGALPCKMDEWGIDVLISGSQKGFMIPPGLSFLAASERAIKVSEECANPSFYFNWKQNRKSVLDASTAWTPAVNLFVALDTALQMMKEEGLDNIWKRHARIASAIRAGVKAIGLELLVKDEKLHQTQLRQFFRLKVFQFLISERLSKKTSIS